MRIGLVTLVVRDYDEAIEFYVQRAGFSLVADDEMGGGKRWVVVTPPGGTTGLLLAKAVGEQQSTAIGNQAGGRVGFFMFTADFPGTHQRMADAGVEFLEAPRREPYGWVCVWRDLYGNTWDLLEER
jgi:catechol 2,3-dioxygenase-like lactoylglutathione lyase family enzyme